jgi:hypothetical protein
MHQSEADVLIQCRAGGANQPPLPQQQQQHSSSSSTAAAAQQCNSTAAAEAASYSLDVVVVDGPLAYTQPSPHNDRTASDDV